MNLNQSVLVGASGRALFGVGGQSAFSTHEYRGYVVSLEWDESDGEPMLMMWTALGGRDAGVFGIGLSSAGKYANANGTPTDECFIECAQALAMLGRNVLEIELRALVDVVMRFIPDLLAMPPAPRAIRRQAKGEAFMDIVHEDHKGRKLGEASI